jgi:hypothetical protein
MELAGLPYRIHDRHCLQWQSVDLTSAWNGWEIDQPLEQRAGDGW